MLQYELQKDFNCIYRLDYDLSHYLCVSLMKFWYALFSWVCFYT